VAPGEAKQMPKEGAAIRQAEAMSRDPTNVALSCLSGAVIRTSETLATPQ
jgi:hypothetical protein